MFQAKPRIFHVLIAIVFPVLALFTTAVQAHSPHDVVESVALSPDYENDQTLLVYVFDELKRSIDGGHTWKNLGKGLDNTKGLVSDLVTSPDASAGNVIFAATYGDGIYRSNDRGESWRPVNQGLTNLDINRLVLSPDYPNDRTLAATPHYGNALYISTTGGNSWREIQQNEFTAVSLTITKENGKTRLLAGTAKGDFYLSGDGFETWAKQGSIIGAGKITDISHSVRNHHKETIFIGTEAGGLYKTHDLGRSFIHISELPAAEKNQNPAYITSVTAMENSQGEADVFVTRWHDSALFSADGGKSWKKLSNGLKNDKQADEYEVPHFYEFATTPEFSKHGHAFIAGFAGLFKTTNGGQSWLELETRPARNIEGMALSPFFPHDQTIALATYDGGAYISRDSGKTWTAKNIGLTSTHLWDISITRNANDDLTFFANSNQAFLTSKETDFVWLPNRLATSDYWKHVTANFAPDSIITKIAWRLLGNPESPFPTQIALSANFASDETLFLGTRYKGVLKSTDGGITWLHPWNADNGWVTSLKISPNFNSDGSVFAAVREKGFYLSTDGGNSWQSANTGLSTHAVDYELLETSVIELSPEYAKDQRIYFGTADGLYLSTDQGRLWKRLQVTGIEQNELIRAIGISPAFATDGAIFVSVKGRGLYLSTDRGESFTAIAPDLIGQQEVIKLFRFSPDYAQDHTIFAASAEEAYVSHDSGTNWLRLDRPIRYEDTKDSIIYHGAWEWKYSAASSAQNTHRSNTPGDKAVFHFVGTQITWYGPKSNEYGTAKVYLDGNLLGKVEQASTTRKENTAIHTISGLPWGSHTFVIEVDNENSPDHYIAIDALEVF